jgi:ubiquitin conjugation factor E4 B
LDANGPLPWLPEHLLEDVVTVPIHLARIAPSSLQSLAPAFPHLFAVVVRALAKSEEVHSPHLRAKLGDLLFEVFLGPTEKPHQRQSTVGPQHSFLHNDAAAQRDLAPALLKLYGDVEHIGFYEKLENRFNIALVLKHLWSSPGHRSTFQHISQDSQAFTKFANGLMNETNRLVGTMMEKLPEIREFQQRQSDPAAWQALTEQQREDMLDRLQSSERELRASMNLCNETIHMLVYLSTDPQICEAFLTDALVDRLASMLLSVLTHLVGSKGLDIKVRDPEAYNFRPKTMLREICQILMQFSRFPAFCSSVSQSGYFTAGLLPKTLSTIRKHKMFTDEDIQRLEHMAEAVGQVVQSEDRFADAPEEFLDPVMFTLMREPVLLPSGHIMDRATIEQHLLNDPTNPFTRDPLSMDDVKPHSELLARISAWKASQMEE